MQPDPLDRNLAFVLHDVARLLRKRFEQNARAGGLGMTRAQWSVLAHVARNEGINQSALAEILEIEPITLVRLLDKLEAQDLIERRADPADRRVRLLHLTAAAHPLLTQIRAIGAETREEAMAGLDAGRRDELIDTLLAIKANLSERTDRPADAKVAEHG